MNFLKVKVIFVFDRFFFSSFRQKICLDKKASESTADASERVIIDDEMLKKCPGIDRLRADTRDKLKTYLQEQLLKAYLNDTWKSQNQNKSVEVINLKRQYYENQQKLVDTIEE